MFVSELNQIGFFLFRRRRQRVCCMARLRHKRYTRNVCSSNTPTTMPKMNTESETRQHRDGKALVNSHKTVCFPIVFCTLFFRRRNAENVNILLNIKL